MFFFGLIKTKFYKKAFLIKCGRRGINVGENARKINWGKVKFFN